MAQYCKEWRARNKNHVTEYNHKYNTSPIGISRVRRYKNTEHGRAMTKHQSKVTRLRRYGLTIPMYEKMLDEQKNVCAMCKGDRSKRYLRGLSVDHDHVTGKVRELLCVACNRLIGFADERIDVLEAAIAYLKKHKGDTIEPANA